MAPQHKERVIAALKRRGRTVGYLGDGVNDAPALHTADVGISVDSGAGVAKEAASIVLLEHDLSVVRDAVIEGRRAVENAVKYILMGTSSNFGNMFSMAGAALVLPILPMLPVQVLLNNLLYDVSELGIPFDDVDAETLQKPVRWDLSLIKRFMLVLGPISSVFDFITFFILLEGIPRRRGGISDRMVRRIAGYPGAGRLRHPVAEALVSLAAASRARRS